MFSKIIFLLSILLQKISTEITIEKHSEWDLTTVIEIKRQFSEMSIVVFCFENETKSPLLISQLNDNTEFSFFLINYDTVNNITIPEDNAYLYIAFFENLLNLKHFIQNLHNRVHVLFIFSINGTENIKNISCKLCAILSLYIFDLSSSKLLICAQGINYEKEMKYVKFLGKTFPQVRDVSDFQGRIFNIGTIAFPERLKYR